MLRRVSSLILCTFLLIGCNIKTNNSYEFAKGYDLPVVEFDVNGIHTSLLVDSGAEHSMLLDRFANKNRNRFTFSDTTYIASITANGIDSICIYNTNASINDSLNVCFIVSDISNATDELSKCSYKEVVGILGYDFIKNNGVVFDYNKKILPKFKQGE